MILRRWGLALSAAALLSQGLHAQSAPAEAERLAPAEPEHSRLPPREFRSVDIFLDAFGIQQETAAILDPFWRPAIDALVAANPDKADLARSFAEARRNEELSVYPSVVAFSLDRMVLGLLYPEARRQLEALQERHLADYRQTRTFSPERAFEYTREVELIRSGPSKRIDSDLTALAALAATADGAALRDVLRQGYAFCIVNEYNGEIPERRRPGCARMESSTAVQRVRRAPRGDEFILIGAFTHVQLVGMVAMAHAAGISLHRLLPPEQVEAAGLAIPPDQSDEELVGGHAQIQPESLR